MLLSTWVGPVHRPSLQTAHIRPANVPGTKQCGTHETPGASGYCVVIATLLS